MVLKTKTHFKRLNQIRKNSSLKSMLSFDNIETRFRHPVYDTICSLFTSDKGKSNYILRRDFHIGYNSDGFVSYFDRRKLEYINS